MVRGVFTAASGMIAQQHRLDALSNNLANADTVGYKRDVSVQKAFPELLLRRMNDDGVIQFPYRGEPVGSVDKAAVVGKLGTGVEQNEVFTIFEQGAVHPTENAFDLALEGDGFFVVRTPQGDRLTRNGSFSLGPEGILVTQQGYPVLGDDGNPLEVKLNNFVVDEAGKIFANERYLDDPDRLVQMRENQWDETLQVGQLRLVGVEEARYLQKQGTNLWRTTRESGDAEDLLGDRRPQVLQGFLEKANINVVVEMTNMIEVNRAYEANQKVVQSHDQSTGRLISEVLRAQ
ncbi:flagellar basal-body rod protein FlgG [Alkalispirochaeta americana]|uniref:Flagellar basal-body rod protein FlgG n=1 Tax=Alkalispirochaeta americana TaxID=159291 RepID=A0A1N6PX22_9SPIO|nr:flagellar hook-basal body protein [Alkalispirochaeta americana]SIQ08836.1 flagellar basal-body rod protein FlgG [Alkalispirochaeta americana]